MKLRHLFFFACFVSTLSYSQPYVAGHISIYKLEISHWDNVTTPHDHEDFKFKPSFGLHSSLGYKFREVFRTEFEFYYNHDAKIKAENATKASHHSYMFNFLFDIFVFENFTPYIGFGLGSAIYRFKNNDYNFERGRYANIQLIYGISYRYDEKLSFDFSRRIRSSDFFLGDANPTARPYVTEQYARELLLGIRRYF